MAQIGNISASGSWPITVSCIYTIATCREAANNSIITRAATTPDVCRMTPFPESDVESVLLSGPEGDVESILLSGPEGDVESILLSSPEGDVESVLLSGPEGDVESIMLSSPEGDVESVLSSVPT